MRAFQAMGVVAAGLLVLLGCGQTESDQASVDGGGAVATSDAAGGSGGTVSSATSRSGRGGSVTTNSSGTSTTSATTVGSESTVGSSGGSGGASIAVDGYRIDFVDPIPEHRELLGEPAGASASVLVQAISSDGDVIAGVSNLVTPGPGGGLEIARAFRWTRATGSLPLRSVTDDEPLYAVDWVDSMSADGSVIVGRAVGADGTTQLFRWTEQTGFVTLGLNDPGASLVSADGSTIAVSGRLLSEGVAQRWRQGTGFEALDLLGQDVEHRVVSINEDGSIIYGNTAGAAGRQAFRYSEVSGVQPLAVPEGYEDCGLSWGASMSRGRALVGDCASPPRAFVYNEDSGFVDLGELEGFTSYTPRSASQDAAVVFGEARADSDGAVASFRYTEGGGMLVLDSFARQLSSQPRGGQEGLARDGSVAIGTWTDTLGASHAYVWEETSGMRELRVPSGFAEVLALAVHPEGTLVGGLARDQAGSTISTAVIWDPDGTPRLLSEKLLGVGIELDETVLLTVEAFTPTGLLLGGARSNSYHRSFLVQLE